MYEQSTDLVHLTETLNVAVLGGVTETTDASVNAKEKEYSRPFREASLEEMVIKKEFELSDFLIRVAKPPGGVF